MSTATSRPGRPHLEQDHSGPKPPTSLRLALALKGGVSLAVWMGGACREIAELMRGMDGAYAPYLRSAGYTHVDVDVISGSSAGGLNGVMLAQHVAYGAAFDATVRELWLRTADLGRLARAPFVESPLSFLRGDHALYPQVAEAMEELEEAGRRGTTEPIRRQVRLLVTTTRLRPRREEIYPDIGARLPTDANAAVFRFVGQGSIWPDSCDQPHLICPEPWSRDRLAYAARCSSSFPGAFEPGRIDVRDTAGSGEAPGPYVAMAGPSSETGWPDSHAGKDVPAGVAEVVDGGVLDNVPIGWALRSIASMPAQAPVDRWLVYLDPSPTARPRVDESRVRPVVMLQLIRKALRVKSNAESLLDDAREFARTSRTVEAHQAALDAALLAAHRPDLEVAAETSWADYATAICRAEGARLRQLFADPVSMLVADPLPFRGTRVGPVDFESALAATPGTREQGDPARAGEHARTPLVAARALTLLLGAIRKDEAEGASSDVRASRELFYAVRAFIEVVVGIRDRALIAAACAEGSAEGGAYAGAGSAGTAVPAVRVFDHATRRTAALITAAAAKTSGEAGSTAYWLSLTQRLADSVWLVDDDVPPASTGTSDEAPYRLLWAGVTAVCDSLPASVKDGLDTRVLSLVEVLTGPTRPDPLSSPAVPHFAVLSAANRSPLETELLGVGINDRNRVALKLSGNELGNFGGFLSARWRHNDWTWGRLDAAQTLLEIIARRGHGAGSASALVHESSLDTAVVARQEQILDEELRFLVTSDAPPRDGAGTALPEPGSPDRVDAKGSRGALGLIGAESVLELLSKRPLRRTVVHLGLNLFAGLTSLRPGGQGSTAEPDRRYRGDGMASLGLRLLLGPLVTLPIITSVASPAASFITALLIWLTLAVGTGQWAGPTHLLVVGGIALAALGGSLRLMAGAATRAARRGETPRIVPGATMATTGAGVLGLVAWFLLRQVSPPPHLPLLAGALAAAAFLVSQFFTLTAAPKRWATLTIALVTAAVVAVTTVATAVVDVPGRALSMLYIGLLATLVGLTTWIVRTTPAPVGHPFASPPRTAPIGHRDTAETR